MLEDGDYRRTCSVCLRRFEPVISPTDPPAIPLVPELEEDDPREPDISFGEVFGEPRSWDIYQPVL
jgi:hypothetical protein